MQGNVKIGREFFDKIKLDYADWRWALVREFLQNCFDAPGSRNVSVVVERSGEHTLLTVANDGQPMSREVLTEKLLTLGGSGKNFEGENTGGFGVAKSLLYYCHLSYTISTGPLTVDGSGAQYSITETSPITGTRSTVVVDGNEVSRLQDAVRKFASMSQWKGKLILNGEVLITNTHKGARRRDLGWVVVYTNNSFENTCIVRLNGQPMFSMWTQYRGCVLLELTGKACSTLTSNRDGLVHPYRTELQNLLTALAVDKRTALREQKAEYKRYQGEVQRNQKKQPKAAEEGLAAVVDLGNIAAQLGGGCPTVTITPEMAEQLLGGQEHGQSEQAPPLMGGIKLNVVSKEEAPISISVGPQFILKNTTGLKTPTYYTPGEGFSKYSRELVTVWTKVLLKLHQVCNREGEFSVGFVFDEENEAEHEMGPYGRVYYVNPVRVKEEGCKRTVERRWESAWQDRCEIIALACHEFVHGAFGLKQHDEDYAGVLTEVMAAAFANMHDLTQLCRPPAPKSFALGTATPLRKG